MKTNAIKLIHKKMNQLKYVVTPTTTLSNKKKNNKRNVDLIYFTKSPTNNPSEYKTTKTYDFANCSTVFRSATNESTFPQNLALGPGDIFGSESQQTMSRLSGQDFPKTTTKKKISFWFGDCAERTD